jgi:nucleoside-diphosphate-sugar epimerase
MYKIFITGGNGYVGRNLAQYFANKGYQIVVLIRKFDDQYHFNHSNIKVVIGSLSSIDLKKLMEGSDTLIHTAADIDHSNKSKTQWETNVVGTERVLDIAKQLNFKTFIHLSSESVLATGQNLIQINEKTPIPKLSVGHYSKTKACAERIAQSYSSEKLRGIIIRPRMIWGRDDTTALPQLISAVKKNQLAWIDGGHYLTSTTHILNLCYGIELALEKGISSEIYMISDGEPIEFRSFVTSLLATKNIQAPKKEISRNLLKNIAKTFDILQKMSFGIVHGPITFQQYSASAVEITLDISKAEKELGYVPIISRSEGLAEIQI